MKAKKAQQNNFDDKIKDIQSKIAFFERWVGREQRIDHLKDFRIRKKIEVDKSVEADKLRIAEIRRSQNLANEKLSSSNLQSPDSKISRISDQHLSNEVRNDGQNENSYP